MSEIFTQNIIAILWDFDRTLTPGYMQNPLFDHYGVDKDKFWDEVDNRVKEYRNRGVRALHEVVYLNQILDYVKDGRFEGLNNQHLKEFGRGIQFYEGLPDFLGEMRRLVDQSRRPGVTIKLEHYVLSSGLCKMIEGSAIASYLDGVWACEFVESETPPHVPEKIAYVIDHTTKTRAVFEINKGANVQPTIDVNAVMPKEERRVPIRQMIYVGDGPSDVPVFSVVKEHGGHTLAVYDPSSEEAHKQAYQLNEEGRVDHYAEAIYRSDSGAGRWLAHTVNNLADQISERHERKVREHVGHAVKHTPDSD